MIADIKRSLQKENNFNAKIRILKQTRKCVQKVILKGQEGQASWSQHFLVTVFDVLIGC